MSKTCYRCGDSAKDYPGFFKLVTRTLDNQKILVCEPCAENIDRKDAQKDMRQFVSRTLTRRQAAFCMGYFHGEESKTTLKPSEVESRWPHLSKHEIEAYCGGRVAGQGGREDLLPVRQFDINEVSRLLKGD